MNKEQFYNDIEKSLRSSNRILDSRFEEEENYFYIELDEIDVDEVYNLSRIVGVTHVVVNPNNESTIQVNLSF